MSDLKIISGGQSGVDRVALDVAIELGLEHGGWCPKERWAEDGPIDTRYKIIETPSAAPEQRTEWNVRDSDGTVVISIAENVRGGTRRTLELAHRLRKPLLHLHGGTVLPGAERLAAFIEQHRIAALNVAGPRLSEEANAAVFAKDVLTEALRRRAEKTKL